MDQKRLIIACEVVLKELLPFLPPHVKYETLDAGLHVNTKKLHGALQDLIDKHTGANDFLVLGYGLCSRAVIGLKAKSSMLAIPRVDDCLGLFLGSMERYRRQIQQVPGTYFLSKGWIDAGITLVDEFRRLEERYDGRRVDFVKNQMLKHYTRLAFIDLGHPDSAKYRRIARDAADHLQLDYEVLKGTSKPAKKLIAGPLDEGLILVPAGKAVTLEDFGLV